jgi:hypothetical protein
MSLLHHLSAEKFAGPSGKLCPICDQPIPNEKTDQARSRLEAREREVSQEVGARVQAQFKQELAQLKASANAELESVKRDGALAVEAAAQEATKREALAREQGAAAARDEASRVVTEAERAKAELLLRYDTLRAEHDSILEQRVEELREAMETQQTGALAALKVKHFEEKQRLTGHLEQLTRQLERKADDKGEGAEVDLFEALREEFPRDIITRVAKGSPGADVIHDVYHNDRLCGRLIYDCKDRNSWRAEYALKLRVDQTAAGADHAILSTRTLPSNARQICEIEGVLVANPARVVALVHIVRRHLVQLSSLRLGNEQRASKTAELYDFIRSEKCARMFDMMDSQAADLQRLQEQERRAHESNWKRQEGLYRTLRKTSADMRSEIDRIIQAVGETACESGSDGR